MQTISLETALDPDPLDFGFLDPDPKKRLIHEFGSKDQNFHQELQNRGRFQMHSDGTGNNGFSRSLRFLDLSCA